MFALLLSSIASLCSLAVTAQSGRVTSGGEKSTVLNVIARAQGGDTLNLVSANKDRLLLFDGGIEQQVEYLRADTTGARIVFLADNTQTLRGELSNLQKVAEAIIGELYEGDEMMIITFNEQAEIVQDFTEQVKPLKEAATRFRRQGFPKLYDALAATVEDAFRKQIGINKRVIILASDGYDRDSSTKYEQILATLLNENIVVYGFQAPDRTFGAIRARDTGPKPVDALTGLVESTGGVLFKLDKPETFAQSAKTLIDELRDGWYTLAYTPKGVNAINARRLLITCPEDKLILRTKKLHPSQLQ
jgi:VWFA-related protein